MTGWPASGSRRMLARRYQDETWGHAPQQRGGVAPVGAVMGGNQRVGPRRHTGCEERRFASRFEIARQQDRSAARSSGAEYEASIVERPIPIGDGGMQHRKGDPRADASVTACQSPDCDAARHRQVEDLPRLGIARRAGADPQLADLEVAQDRKRAAGVIVVVVREGEDLEPAAPLADKRGHDDPITGVEASAPRRAGIDEDRPAVRTAQDDGEPLPDVEDRDAARARCGWGRTQVECGQAAGEQEADRAPRPGAPTLPEPPRGEQENHIPRDQADRRPRHTQMPAWNGRGPA